MTLETIAILILAGIVGGAWNAVAGGATLFTFPALMLAGLPPVVANATNFLAMLPSNAAALPAYRQELKGVGREIWPLLLVSGAGAICGSCLLLISEPKTFVALVPFLLLAATSLFAFGGKIRGGLIAMLNRRSLTKPLYVVLFLSSIYGGYFGAGLGIILLAIVQIMGFTNFHVANSLKNLLATSFTIISILVFGAGGIVAWSEAAVMMTGSTLGGYFGGRYTKRVNERLLKIMVVSFGVLLSLVYFYRTWVV